MLKGATLRRTVMSLLETGRHPMTLFTTSLWTGNPTPCSCLFSFPLKKTLCPSSVVVSPNFLHIILQSPRMFHLYLSISCVSSKGVLVFHVPIVMLSLPWILYGAPVAYLTPLSWCSAEGAVLVDPGDDQTGMIYLLVVISWCLKGKIQPGGAHPFLRRTCGRWVRRGTLPPVWPNSSNYDDICPVMPWWHQLFNQ